MINDEYTYNYECFPIHETLHHSLIQLEISKLKDDNHHRHNNRNNNGSHHYRDISMRSPATQERLLQWSLRVRRGFFQLAAWVQCL